jgi:site-specific DNA-methyltransferase (adenine-specific)
VNYRDRSGRSLAKDDNDAGLKTAFRQILGVLTPGSLCTSFHGWNKADMFITASRECHCRPHPVRKSLASRTLSFGCRYE